MENQCLGLAEALGFPFVVKRIHPRAPWKWLPPLLWPTPLASLGIASDSLEPPWPQLLIASGRMSVAPAIAVRRRANGATFTVQIQSPGVSVAHFDIVVPPRHDRLRGDNVLPTRGALHRVTPARMQEEAARLAAAVENLPRPLIAVLVGGSNSVYRFGLAEARKLGEQLSAMANEGAGLIVTPSRRTGTSNERVLRNALSGKPAIIWDGSEPNPYFGFLGLADAVVVTCDSVSMTSEAASTGKPVYVADLPGGSPKFRAFHQGLRSDGVTRPLTGQLEYWSYAPLNDTSVVAAEVRRRLKLHSSFSTST